MTPDQLRTDFLALLDKKEVEQVYQDYIERNTRLVPREFVQTEAELRSTSLRHNLKELHARCKSAGLVDAGAAFLESALAEKHSSFEFRYMKPGGQYPAYDLRLMFNAFSTLDAAVDQAVGGSASVGLAVRPAPWVFPDQIAAWRL